ncbi:hypothetical protein [Shewanella aestuarii]|uniref:Uncharacterized protein n=1 Tax=Shewanella aestuarii TaxID=1028752 RepID=A0A6G9QPV3_9GAMM|nr:hypothetical protein [Shewanella aestuarii]QIR16502.1 hypothetical protein HBH39_18675 [Shewanella aestuarii]
MNSEQSVKTVLEMAFNITQPELTTLKCGDEMWPLKMGMTKLEPFLMSYCTAIHKLLNITTQINSSVVAVNEDEFEVMYQEHDELDLATFLLIAVDGVDQVLECSEVNNETIDVSQLIQAFSPKNLGIVPGELLDSNRLQQGLISSILKEAGVLPIKTARKIALKMVDNITEQNSLSGPAL